MCSFDMPSNQQLRCPTCDAQQIASPVCRRCKCDLTLVVDILATALTLKRRCCHLLDQGLYEEAAVAARRLVQIEPDEDSVRYLGVCYLLLGQYAAAARLAVQRLA